MSDVARNIDWDTVEYFARAGPEVRWAHYRGAYRVWLERFDPFRRSGIWSFDTIDEFRQFQEAWQSTLKNSGVPTPRSSSSSSTSTG